SVVPATVIAASTIAVSLTDEAEKGGAATGETATGETATGGMRIAGTTKDARTGRRAMRSIRTPGAGLPSPVRSPHRRFVGARAISASILPG
ncbi:MAG: hypothetical protein JWN69_2066, partial [Alphaproteobacteria bacterium]|nr:hypothetical protein [Alphaproteobacteria bacterium]